MHFSDREQLERRLHRLRHSALDAQLALARQAAIIADLKRRRENTRLAERVLSSLRTAHSAAEREFRGLQERWRGEDDGSRSAAAAESR